MRRSKHEVFRGLMRAYRESKREFVTPAWIAGIQGCKDASGDIRVSLDSITPCWNDVLEKVSACIDEPSAPNFEGALSGRASTQKSQG